MPVAKRIKTVILELVKIKDELESIQNVNEVQKDIKLGLAIFHGFSGEFEEVG